MDVLAWVSGVSGEKGKDGSEKGREVNEYQAGWPDTQAMDVFSTGLRKLLS